MTRTALAVVAVLFGAVAPSSAGGTRAVAEPVADSYIVVLKADAARSQGEAHSRPGRPPEHVSLRSRAMSETTIPLDQQLEEIRAQLAWVRDYL
jgi:hypothetical protein